MARISVDAEASRRVSVAMAATPRALFLPPAVRHLADSDHPVMIGWDATNSQPSTVRRMLELLDVRSGHRVLDVGSGSAWTTAILATLAGTSNPTLAGASGSVFGVEVVTELVDYGRDRLAAAAVQAEIRRAEPGVLGLPDAAPFDRILVSASPDALPEDLVAQLADGGRMVIPVAGVMTVVGRRADRISVTQDDGRYTFVPLR